VRKQRLP